MVAIIQRQMRLDLEDQTVEICRKSDSKLYKQATEKYKRARRIISLAQMRRKQNLIAAEGPMHEVGMF